MADTVALNGDAQGLKPSAPAEPETGSVYHDASSKEPIADETAAPQYEAPAEGKGHAAAGAGDKKRPAAPLVDTKLAITDGAIVTSPTAATPQSPMSPAEDRHARAATA